MSLKDILSQSPAWRGAIKIINLLEEAGHEAYIVGGCVRDAWLQLHSTTPGEIGKVDFDIATSARPEDIVAIFHSTITVGAAFGVVMVRFYGIQYEVATFRQDLEYLDGRRPSGVRFATIEEDVKRRDFTINGLLYSPGKDEMRDLVEGCADLEAGLIRTIGNPRHRFEEDHLRLIRAVRFAARFRFTIEPETLQAIREMAAQLTTVSLERLRDELSRIMRDPRPDYGLELLQNSGLLSTILQLFPVPNLALERLTRLRKLALSTIPSDLRPPAFFIFLCCPLQNHQADPHRVQRTLRLFRFANSEAAAGGTMVSHLFRIRDFDHLRHADRIRLLRDQHFPGAHILAATLYNLPLATIDAEIKRLEGQQLSPPPLITGKELKAAGLEPGPQFKEILYEIETRQLEGTLQDSAAALELALQLAVVD